MSDSPPAPTPPRSARAVLGVLPLALGGAFLLPRIDLGGDVAYAASWLTELGGIYGAPLVTLVVAGVYLSRPGLSARERRREAGVLATALLVIVGLFAWLNEFVVKPGFGQPRPNIVELADAGVLGMTPAAFYALGDKDARRAYLATLHLEHLPAAIRGHWLRETGYSFPSGHALFSMTLATCFACLGLWALDGPRRWCLLLLVPWALSVCYTRPLLRVHTPTDVLVGGSLGACAGLTAAWITQRFGRGSGPEGGQDLLGE